MIWVSTTANDDWTDFPAHLAYAPLMQELLAHSVKSGTYWMNLEVGQPLTIPSSVRMTAVPVTARSGQESTAVGIGMVDENAGRVGGASTIYRSTPLARPGVYTLSLGDATIPIAVNIPRYARPTFARSTTKRSAKPWANRDDAGGRSTARRDVRSPRPAATGAGT